MISIDDQLPIVKNQKQSKKALSNYSRPTIDKVVYLAIFSPIMTIPQLYLIWSDNAQGVSKITWIAYMCVATVMLLYAIKYRLKPLIVVQTCWVLVDSLVVAGLLLYQ